MAKLRINGDSSGYVDLEAPNAASSSTLDLDQVPQKNAANTFTETQQITNTTNGAYYKINAPTSGDISSGYLVYQGSTIRGGFYTNPTHGMTHISDNYHTFRNNNANRMTIDSNGYVTTPYQPAFHASGGSQQTAAGIVQFITLMTNTGNHYNSSNYRFTAPTTGVYKFSARIMKAQNATVDFHFRVNGSQVGDNIYDTATATNQLNSGTANMVRHLNSGDYVQVYSASTSTVNWIHAGHREFSGYLIG